MQETFQELEETSARGRLWIKFNETNNEKPLKSKVRDRQENNSKTFLRPVPHLLVLSSRLFIVFCCFVLSSLCSPHISIEGFSHIGFCYFIW